MENQRRKLWPYILLGVMLAFFLGTVTKKVESVEYNPDVLKPIEGPGITVQLPEAATTKRNRKVAFYCVWEEGVLLCGQNTDDQITESGFDPAMSLEEYAAICAQDIENASEVFTDEYGNVCFTYDVVNSKNALSYYVTVKRGTDSFWICNFVCEQDLKEYYNAYFPHWASLIVAE